MKPSKHFLKQVATATSPAIADAVRGGAEKIVVTADQKMALVKSDLIDHFYPHASRETGWGTATLRLWATGTLVEVA
jgi:hypothetical protein